MTVPMAMNTDKMNVVFAFLSNDEDNNDDNTGARGGAFGLGNLWNNPFINGGNQEGNWPAFQFAGGPQDGSNPGPMEQLLGGVGQVFDQLMNPDNWPTQFNGQAIRGQYPRIGGTDD